MSFWQKIIDHRKFHWFVFKKSKDWEYVYMKCDSILHSILWTLDYWKRIDKLMKICWSLLSNKEKLVYLCEERYSFLHKILRNWVFREKSSNSAKCVERHCKIHRSENISEENVTLSSIQSCRLWIIKKNRQTYENLLILIFKYGETSMFVWIKVLFSS